MWGFNIENEIVVATEFPVETVIGIGVRQLAKRVEKEGCYVDVIGTVANLEKAGLIAGQAYYGNIVANVGETVMSDHLRFAVRRMKIVKD